MGPRQKIKTLLDDDSPLFPDPLINRLGALRRSDGNTVDPSAGDLAVTIAWGTTRRGAVMPGAGSTTTAAWTVADRTAAAATAERLGSNLTTDDVERLLGPEMITVALNNRTRIERVPSLVWQAAFGGRNVIKKWLSYRTKSVLGRDLTTAEARHITRMTQSVAALLLLAPALDENYTQVIADQQG